MHISKKHPDVKLKRELSLFEVTMYGVGIIIGAGIYALIGKAAGIAGNAVWMSFIVGAFIACLTGLSYAELGSTFPKSAAEYFYTKKAFRKPVVSFIVEWMMIAVGVVSAATVALGFGGYLSNFTGMNVVVGAVGLIILCAFLNFWGIKQTAKLNILFTCIEMSGLIIIVFLGLGHLGSVNYFETPTGFSGIMSAAVLIFFAYIGFESIVNISEEIKTPKKIIPKALILSIIISSVLYMLISVSAVSILPWETLGQSSAPLADVAEAAYPGSSMLLSVIALFATANTVLIIMLANSRVIWGMAKQRALPKILNAVHERRNTPHYAIFVTAMITILFALPGNIKTIAEITDIGIFFIFIFINASLIAIRYRYPNIKRPFKVPFNIGKFPVLPFFGLLFCAYMLTHFNIFIIEVGISALVIGVVVHYVMKFRKMVKV